MFETVVVSPKSRFIQATGWITTESANDFQRFIAAQGPNLPRQIHLNSPGGDLAASMALGNMISGHRLLTEVGETVPLEAPGATFTFPHPTATRAVLCVLGGVSRYFDAQARFGVHQFAPVKAEIEDEQLTSADIAAYLETMGIEERLLRLAALTSSDKIYKISVPEARELGVIFDPNGVTSFVPALVDEQIEARFDINFDDSPFSGTISCVRATREIAMTLTLLMSPALLQIGANYLFAQSATKLWGGYVSSFRSTMSNTRISNQRMNVTGSRFFAGFACILVSMRLAI